MFKNKHFSFNKKPTKKYIEILFSIFRWLASSFFFLPIAMPVSNVL